jgi:hypothetical protein
VNKEKEKKNNELIKKKFGQEFVDKANNLPLPNEK